MRFVLFASVQLAALVFLAASKDAFALPQYQRLLRQEYGFKSPCSTCHSQGGGSSLTSYGKAFDRAGRSRMAIQNIASQIPAGDTLSFGAKLKARANPNDPKSTPTNPGTWAGASEIPVEELKSFAPPDASNFTLLEGELKAEQIARLKTKLGEAFEEEDRFPTFYFGEVAGKKTYVIQYVRLPKVKKTIGLVVSTKGTVVNATFVGANKGELPQQVKDRLIGKTLSEVEKLPQESDAQTRDLRNAVIRGLSAINVVFGKL